MNTSKKDVLYYVHDPMCSWCWAFRPTWQSICENLPDAISVHCVLGGLAPDSNQPMPMEMQTKIRSIWKTIQQQVPGTQFNHDFWRICRPRRSTYPACKAVIAATRQGSQYEDPMILAIQQAYYLNARNPSDDDVLIDLTLSLGLDKTQFEKDLNARATENELLAQITLSRELGAYGFPSLIVDHNGRQRIITHDYNDPAVVLRQL